MGPFSRLRPGCHVREYVHIGNFAEAKNSDIGAHTHMGHFSYMGDTICGEHVNYSAGVITCNYDGENKKPDYHWRPRVYWQRHTAGGAGGAGCACAHRRGRGGDQGCAGVDAGRGHPGTRDPQVVRRIVTMSIALFCLACAGRIFFALARSALVNMRRHAAG